MPDRRSKEIKADILYPSACTLGESPVWHEERKSCFWVDIEEQSIYEYHLSDKKIGHYQLNQRVSLVIPGQGNELILGLQGGVGRYNLSSRTLSWITDLGIDWKNFRCNDGGCDSEGRLWVSTMELQHKKEAGALYLISHNKEVKKKIDQLSIPNGMAWSPDNKRLYHTDSVTCLVRSFIYDENTGGIQFEKIAVRIPDKTGLPDGMAMDEEGMLWIALWGGFGVGRFDPASGKMIGFVDIPAPQVSSCSFAGERLDQLVITTARNGMTTEELINYPKSGHVFITRPGVKGIPGFRCGL